VDSSSLLLLLVDSSSLFLLVVDSSWLLTSLLVWEGTTALVSRFDAHLYKITTHMCN
jgi:hypothetical protein